MMNSTNSSPGFMVCPLEEITDGKGRIFEILIDQRELRLLVLRSGNSCYGYVNRCPHFGIPLAACDSQLIFESNLWVKCNVHYARFRWQDGFCEAGDCEGDSLQSVPLEVQGGKIFVAAYPQDPDI